MQISEIITNLRKEHNLSQEDLAQTLFVTRQAVSKWERDEAFPGSDVMLRISSEYGIPVAALMGAPEDPLCQSCGMPLSQFPQHVNKHNADYCVWCYGEDDYVQAMALDDMIEHIIRAGGIPKEVCPDTDAARRFLRVLLPELERWKA